MKRPLKPPKPLPKPSSTPSPLETSSSPPQTAAEHPSPLLNTPVSSIESPSPLNYDKRSYSSNPPSPSKRIQLNDETDSQRTQPDRLQPLDSSTQTSTIDSNTYTTHTDRIEENSITDNSQSSRKTKFLSPEHWQKPTRPPVGTSSRPSYNSYKYELSLSADPQGDDAREDSGGRNPSPALGGIHGVDTDSLRLHMYHKIHYGDEWMFMTVLMHAVQFSILITIGYAALNTVAFTVLLFLVLLVILLLGLSRYFTVKLPRSLDWSYKTIRTPDQETDIVSDSVIYLLSAAAILEGGAYALYPTASAGYDEGVINQTGFRSYETLSQTLSFASIVLFGFHRILRPSNRLDPLRTVFELEIVSICWDALDGSSLYELISASVISPSFDTSARFLMCFWYLSIGLRLAMMYCAHLTPTTYIYRHLLSPALSWSPEPTVDRTLSSIYFRAFITLMMSFPQFFAAGLRISLWNRGELSSLQQEMMAKNILFLIPAGSAIFTRMMVKGRYWNTRQLLVGTIPYLNIKLNIIKPSRQFQIEVLRYTFVVTYLITGAMFSSLLTHVTESSTLWVNNVASDVILCAIFLLLCRAVHKPKVWILFPLKLALVLGIVMFLNLYVARIPAIYRNVNDMEEDGETWSYNNALLIVLISIVPISTYALFWAVCNMVFHAEFTACPENYNAVHDPAITLVSSATMLEGALDIISCASLLSLAQMENLPDYMDGAVIFFAFMEIVNACQCFVLQVLLSAGYDDTPAHLVRWRANLRLGRGVIDLGTFALRLALWIQFNAVTMERGKGVENYRKDALFMQYVRPKDWYGMNQDEWREATRESLPEQAQSGRAV